jgi:hypothetical protein
VAQPATLPLPDRVLDRLREHGPDSVTGLSHALGARHGAVSQAITSLCRRELVDRSHQAPAAGRGGHPKVFYYAIGCEGPDVDAAACEVISGPDTLLERMAVETAMLRAEYPDVEFGALVYSNGPIPGI